jgi:hypothetical protein
VVDDLKSIIDTLADKAREDAIDFFITYHFEFLSPRKDRDPKQVRIYTEELLERVVTRRMERESSSLIQLLVSFINQYIDELKDSPTVWSVVSGWDAEQWKEWETESKDQWGWIAHDLYLINKAFVTAPPGLR